MMKMMLFTLLFTSVLSASDFKEQEELWRKERETKLKSESGWLNLAGLFWLKDGTYTFGTSLDAQLRMPMHSTVGIAGSFAVKGDQLTFTMARAQSGYLNGELKREGILALESSDPNVEGPDVLACNNLRMFLIKRGDTLGLRLRDLKAEALREFKGIESFPARSAYVVKATLEPFDLPKKAFLANEIGTETIMESPGILKFKMKENDFKLLSFTTGKDDSELFIIFTDKTTGIDTYSSGRYLYAKKIGELTYELNFNRAVNPPCAFTPFATCPFAPEENSLDIEVKAGEKIYHSGEKSEPPKQN